MPLYIIKKLKLSSFLFKYPPSQKNILFSHFFCPPIMKRNKEIVSLPCNYDIRHFPILLNIRSLIILDISIPIPITHACTRTSVKAYVTQAETSSDLIRQGFHSFKHLLIFQTINDDYFPTSYPSHLSVPSSFIQFLSSPFPHLCHP